MERRTREIPDDDAVSQRWHASKPDGRNHGAAGKGESFPIVSVGRRANQADGSQWDLCDASCSNQSYITTARGFTVASDKQSALLDASEIDESYEREERRSCIWHGK